jgi:hypothetical protein
MNQKQSELVGQGCLLFWRSLAPETARGHCRHALKINVGNNFGLHHFHDALLIAGLYLLIGFRQLKNFLADPLNQSVWRFLLRAGTGSDEEKKQGEMGGKCFKKFHNLLTMSGLKAHRR